MHRKLKSVVIVSESASFPWGMASTTRVRNIAKSLIASGVTVEYIGLRGADVEHSIDKKKKGTVQGIKYYYPARSPVRSNKWWLRRVDDLLGKWLTVLTLFYLKVIGKLDAVVIYSRDYKTALFWSKLLRFMKVIVVLELCEWPLAIAKTRGSGYGAAKKFCNDAVLMVDGVLPISSYIDKEVQKAAKPANITIPSLRIPILIDFKDGHESQTKKSIEQEPYLLYAGSISYMDIAMVIVDISCELKKRGRDIKIKFTGGGFPEQVEQLKLYARDKEGLEQFDFTGFVDENVLNRLMQNATALLAPLPNNIQSISRFPTKLGYYLASGRPVVTTAVGEVNDYLIDGENAFIALNCSADSIANKLEQVLNNPTLADKVGQQGCLLCRKKFRYSVYSKKLKDFIEGLDYGRK